MNLLELLADVLPLHEAGVDAVPTAFVLLADALVHVAYLFRALLDIRDLAPRVGNEYTYNVND